MEGIPFRFAFVKLPESFASFHIKIAIKTKTLVMLSRQKPKNVLKRYGYFFITFYFKTV